LEAYRVLKPEGLLFCKSRTTFTITAIQWAHIEFMKSAVDVGFCACDCIVKVRKGPIIDPNGRTRITLGDIIATGSFFANRRIASDRHIKNSIHELSKTLLDCIKIWLD